MPELLQDIIVTVVALFALWIVVRRLFAFVRPTARTTTPVPMRFISSKEAQRMSGSTKSSAQTPKAGS